MKFVFREPVFPLLIETDANLFVAMNLMDLISRIKTFSFQTKNEFHAIDSTGEGWYYFHDVNAMAPIIKRNRWTKKEIINFYNSFIKNDIDKFIGRSLSAKTLPKLIEEIAVFDQHPNKNTARDASHP